MFSRKVVISSSLPLKTPIQLLNWKGDPGIPRAAITNIHGIYGEMLAELGKLMGSATHNYSQVLRLRKVGSICQMRARTRTYLVMYAYLQTEELHC